MLVIDPARFDAFAFDLDGVVTETAVVHAAAWKRTFDELLERLARGETWEPFDVAVEYRTYVDGKPRRDGIRSFLDARGLFLPEGNSGDVPATNTIHGLAARKTRHFLDHLAKRGVRIYRDAAQLIARAKAHGIKTAVVSASENCAAVLGAAHLTDVFDVRVDGVDIARLGLHGKPAPDTFLEAARRLDTEPARCVVFEDAIAGVRAGRAGNFGLVIGVDRVGDAEALRRAGADVVVTKLDQIELARSGAGLELR